MREIKPRGIALQRASWHDTDGRPQLIVSALMGFSLTQHRQLLEEDVVWQLLYSHTTEHSVCDLWMAKPRAEVLVWGHAHSRQPTTQMQVTVKCGSVSRTLQVWGDRQWKPGLLGWKATQATAFTSMPLVWERSFGGEGWHSCPLGVGWDSAQRLAKGEFAPLPNIEAIGDGMRTPECRPRSVGLAPVWPTWVDSKQRGTFDKAWLANSFPGMPTDFDDSMFNLAQPEQRKEGFWTGDEPYGLQGLHPTQPRIEGRLPNVRVRCFAACANEVSEVPMDLDTVAFFPSQEVGVLIFRGIVNKVGVDAHNMSGMMAAAEWAEHPRSQAHYHEEFAARLISDSPHSFADEPLMPQVLEPAAAEPPAQPSPVNTKAAVVPPAVPAEQIAALSTPELVPIAPNMMSAIDARDLGLLTPNSTEANVSEHIQVPSSDESNDEPEQGLDDLSLASFLEESNAGLEQLIEPMRLLASAIEQQPHRDISELIAEQLRPVFQATPVGVEEEQSGSDNWQAWVPPRAAQRPLNPEARGQFAARLREWINAAQAALSGLGDHAKKSEAGLPQLQALLTGNFSELLKPVALQQLLNGEHAAQLRELLETVGPALTPQQVMQLTQLTQSGINDWKSSLERTLAAQDIRSELLDPKKLRTWVQSLVGGHGANSKAFEQSANPLIATFQSYLANGMSDALPQASREALADMVQSWSEAEGLEEEVASVMRDAKEVRSIDELLELIDRLSSSSQEAMEEEVLKGPLQPKEAQVGLENQERTTLKPTTAQEDLGQLRSDAVSEPVFSASAARAMLRKLVTEQAAAGESLAGRDFAGADLSGLCFEGLDLSGALLEGANLSGANLRNTKLHASVLINADLRGADLGGAQAAGANLRNVQAQDSVWLNARLQSCKLNGASLQRAILRGSVLIECDFSEADFGHADLSQTQCAQGNWTKALLGDTRLLEVQWTDCNLSSARLDRWQAERAQFRFCDFTDAFGMRADLRGSTLEGSRFLAVSLPKLNASGICAPGTSWTQSSMPGANFRAAELSHALLNESELETVDFEGADLQGAVLNASKLAQSRFDRARLASASLRAADARGASFATCDLQGTDFNGTVIDGCDFSQSQVHELQLRVAHPLT
jgi:uncharacterized protein YjbI with pentapeptide repeats